MLFLAPLFLSQHPSLSVSTYMFSAGDPSPFSFCLRSLLWGKEAPENSTPLTSVGQAPALMRTFSFTIGLIYQTNTNRSLRNTTLGNDKNRKIL